MSRRGVVRCALAAVLFGLSAPAASRLTGEMGSLTLAGLLYVGAALAVAPLLTRAQPSHGALRRSAARLAVAVVLGGAVGPVLLATGLGLVPAATASLLLNLELVFTVVVAALVFREHLGRHVVVGSALVFAGSVALSWSGSPDFRWGALLIAGACLAWAVDNSVTAALDELAPHHITLAKGVIAGGVNLAIGVAIGGLPGLGAVAAALVVGGLGYGASITLWVSGARELGAARGQLVFATAPFIGAVFAWTAFAEPVDGREVLGLVIAAAGVSLVLRSDHTHEHGHDAVEHDHEHGHDDGHHTHSHPEPVVGRHQHRHRHEPLVHHHPHVPDLHHRHEHDEVA